MKKLSLFAASVSTALVCAAVPASINWSQANVRLFSLDTAEARVGRPLTATSVAGVNRRVQRRTYRRAAVAAGAVAGGVVGAGTYFGGPGPAVAVGGPGYGPGPYPGSVIVNPATGRWCTFEPSGWRWCWTP
jgi:hypothetical protein